jgi:enoyl-CoA hydratase/carnithine racemase
MTPDLMVAFMECLAQVRANSAIRSLIVTSVEGHFCAGAELNTEMPGEAQALGGAPGKADQLRQVYAPFLALLDLPIPTVAAVRRAGVGGGFGLACACDFRVVTPETRFIAPFVKLGIHPGMALTHLLPTLVGMPRAMELLLLGREVRGEEAAAWGLATRCVSEDALMSTAHELAGQLAAGAPAVVRWTKRAIHQAVELDPRRAADVESLAQALTFLSDDAEEGFRAFFEKRAPRFEGR